MCRTVLYGTVRGVPYDVVLYLEQRDIGCIIRVRVGIASIVECKHDFDDIQSQANKQEDTVRYQFSIPVPVPGTGTSTGTSARAVPYRTMTMIRFIHSFVLNSCLVLVLH